MTIRIALANVRPPPNPEAAIELAAQAVRDAGARGAQVVCFPEAYVPGYRVGYPGTKPSAAYLERAWEVVAAAAAQAKITVILGTERIVDGNHRLTALVIGPDGRTLGYQDKVQLDPDEDDGTFVSGAGRQVFQAGSLTFGVVICHEGFRYPETVRAAARAGAKVVFHPHFSWATETSFRPTQFADPNNTFHERAFLCRAAENTVWFASANCASPGSPTTSAIVRPDGSLHAWQPYGQEGLLVADLDLALATGLLASRLRS